MATAGRPDGGPSEAELERRKRELDAKLAARRDRAEEAGGPASRTGGLGGMGYALRLSSEFIAAVAVGAGIGWTIDYFASTSPWGLVIFLLLGFVAGVLNVMRSAGMVAPSKVAGPGDAARR